MSYLYKVTESPEQTTIEMRMRNWCVFIALVFLVVLPIAILIAEAYFQDNRNLFRVILVVFMLALYALMDGKAVWMILTAKNKTYTGSIFSFKNPAKYRIKHRR